MNEFDFLHGSWDLANRRLTGPLGSGPATWVEFPGHAVVRPLFKGGGNIEEITFPTLGHQGIALRLFDRETERWSIHWSDSRTGRLDPPLVGGFTGDRGDFYGEDTFAGRPIRVHFTWYGLGPDTARWEQAFSADDGDTWEHNWTMDFIRTGRDGA